MLNATRLLVKNSSKYSIIGYLKGNNQFLEYSNKAASVENNKLDINLSESCIKRLKALKESNKFLRVSVESGGCSGFEYKFSLDNKLEENQDCFIEKDSVKVIIDKETLNLIKGSTIDYYEELIRAGFRVINNPSADHGCSCGSSFSVKL